MSIEFTKVQATNRQAFYETLLTFWDQHWDAQFLRDFLEWRYERRTDGETLIAMSGTKCLGLIDTFIRPYRIGGRRVLVREPCDWYCLPGNRGVGMRLMRFLQAQGEPMVGVGLPETAVTIAPRLKWSHILDTHDFILPLTVRRVVGAVLRKARLGDGAVAKYLPRGLRLQPSFMWTGHQEAHGTVEDILADEWPEEEEWPPRQPCAAHNDNGYAVAPILTKSYVQWLASGPVSLGPVFYLAFRVDGALVGITVCRIEASKVGRKARLIHLHSAKADAQTLRWMIAENVHRAAKFHAESVHCRSSCPVTNAALAGLGFRPTACAPVMTRFGQLGELPQGPVNLTFLRGDDAMIPSLIAE
jgi:hypothetical protein